MKFIYRNPNPSSSLYLYSSAPTSQALDKIKQKYYAIGDDGDEDGQVELIPEKNDFKKKTPNPTTLVKLPGKQTYIFSINNTDDKSVIYTIGINNREIIYLPFDHEFPIQLGAA
jgi:hypothetical protein